jgi:hypothetical protein
MAWVILTNFSFVMANEKIKTIQLEDPISVPQQSIAPAQAVSLNLPALPAKPGKEIVLRFRIVSQTTSAAGCYWTASLALNGSAIGPTTSAGDSRLIGREKSLYLKASQEPYQVFNRDDLMVMFAPDFDQADALTTDGMGATYVLNISDISRGVDVNTLSIRNVMERSPSTAPVNLLVGDIQIGWVDADQLAKATMQAPQRGDIARSVGVNGLKLSQATGGGFRIEDGKGTDLAVETAISMDPTVAAALVAEDTTPKDPQVNIESLGATGYRVTINLKDLRLTRTLELNGGLLRWHDRWTNLSPNIRGIPFQYRFFLRNDPETRFWISGSNQITAVSGATQNPTLFIAAGDESGRGVGVTAESDWLRLLMEMRGNGGMGEIFTRSLALAPNASIDFDLTLSPTTEGGYWRFINNLRQRWGLQGATMDRPFYLAYAVPDNVTDPKEQTRQSFGHLGPVTVAVGSWLGLRVDADSVQSGRFGKADLSPQSPQAAKEVDRFLTYDHRQSAREEYKRNVELIHEACPNVRVVQMMHPAMEVVYRPMLDRWPIQGEAILTAQGKPFEDLGYSRAWLRDYTDHNWGVYYFSPRPGSAYLAELLHRENLSMDAGGDGIYCDEISFAFNNRGYSRYDYGRWDGVSADLDAQGNVVRLKSDNGHVTESAQLQIANAALSRNKFFLANGGPALRSTTSLPVHFFVEGGNGSTWFPRAHLIATPLVFGNFGDSKTIGGVMSAVRHCLESGTIYSPYAVNLLLKSPDNFVSKLYPITVTRIGPGWVSGVERLATIVSGPYPCPKNVDSVQLYRYDDQGNRLNDSSDRIKTPGPELQLDVPRGGMVIAEFTFKK